MEFNPVKYLTFGRLANIVKMVVSYQVSKILKRPVVWGMPVSISVEPTNICNFNCPECPSGTGLLTRPEGVLGFDEFKSIIDQVHKEAFYVQLFLQGEPYINKEIGRMIDYAQSRKMYVSVSTNGSVINKSNVDRIVSSAPDKLIFSMDGMSEETYQKYRVGGTFANADESLRLLIKRKRELGLEKPFVEIQFLVMKHNEHEIDEIKKYGNEAGADKVALKSMQIYSKESAEEFLPKDERFRRYVIKDGEPELKHKGGNYCFSLWKTSVVTWDGKIIPCCFDKDAEYQIAQWNGKPFNNVWKSGAYQEFRKKILEDRSGVKMCTNCTEGLRVKVKDLSN